MGTNNNNTTKTTDKSIYFVGMEPAKPKCWEVVGFKGRTRGDGIDSPRERRILMADGTADWAEEGSILWEKAEAAEARKKDPLMITRSDAFKRNFPEDRFTLSTFEGVNLDLLRYDAETNVGYAVSFVTGQLYGFRVVGTKTYRRVQRRVAVYAAVDTGRVDAMLSFPERTTTGFVHEAVLTDGS